MNQDGEGTVRREYSHVILYHWDPDDETPFRIGLGGAMQRSCYLFYLASLSIYLLVLIYLLTSFSNLVLFIIYFPTNSSHLNKQNFSCFKLLNVLTTTSYFRGGSGLHNFDFIFSASSRRSQEFKKKAKSIDHWIFFSLNSKRYLKSIASCSRPWRIFY